MFDHSGSMTQGGVSKFETARAAVLGFVDAVADGDNDLSPHELALTGFSNGTASTDVGLTTSAAQINAALNGYSPSGFTNIGRALQLGQLELMGGTDPDYLILLSDGSANSPQDIDRPGAINDLYIDVNGDGFVTVLDSFALPYGPIGLDIQGGLLKVSNVAERMALLDVDENGFLDNNDDATFPGKNFAIIDGTLYLDANGDSTFQQSLLSPPDFALGHGDELTVIRTGRVWGGSSDYSGDGSDVYAQYAATAAKNAGTTVYVVGYDLGSSQDATLLQALASPGKFFSGGPDDIALVFDEIIEDLCQGAQPEIAGAAAARPE